VRCITGNALNASVSFDFAEYFTLHRWCDEVDVTREGLPGIGLARSGLNNIHESRFCVHWPRMRDAGRVECR